MFIDPGLPRGVRMAWRLARSRPTPLTQPDEEGDLDFLSALNSTPYRETITRRSALDMLRGTTTSRMTEGESLDSSRAIIEKSSPKWSESESEGIDEDGRISDCDPTTSPRTIKIDREERSQRAEEEARRKQEQEKLERKEKKEETAKANLEELVHRL